MSASSDEFIPTRQSLLSRLKHSEDHESWKEFFETYWRLIFSVALKAGLNQSEAEEVVQETVLSVCKQMPGFRYDRTRSFKAWLLQITRRRIVDEFRKRPPWEGTSPHLPDDSSRTATVHRVPAPEPDLGPVWDEEWQKNLVETAMQRAKARVTPRQYQMFDLYAVKGWPVREVARSLNVSAARVYLAKNRISRIIRDEMRRLEQRVKLHDARLQLTPETDKAVSGGRRQTPASRNLR